MGFFGFLKKQEPLAAPQDPSAAGLPPISSLPAAPDGEIPPPPQPDEYTFESMPGEARLIHDDVHHDSDLDALLTQAPMPGDAAAGADGSAMTAEPEPAPSAPTEEMPDLPELHSAMLTPQEQAMAAPQPVPTPSPAPQARADADGHGLPDFSDDDIAAATLLAKPAQPAAKRPLASERPLPALKPLPILPPSLPDDLYVDAYQYQAALKTIAAFKSAVRKGDAALAGLGAAMNSHKQQFSAFAEQVNAVQEDLIRIDNIMISQR